MTSVKKIERQMLQELKMIKKSARETNSQVYLERNKAHQTKNSPYLTDREFYDSSAIKGTSEERSWKEVKTFDEQRTKWLEHRPEAITSDELEEAIVKKINII